MTDSSACATVETELRNAMAATKCHRCGCFQDAVTSFGGSAALKARLPELLNEALRLFEPKRYDCLGCEVCWPAAAANAAAEIDPVLAEASRCAAAPPVVREGWPPLPGDYRALRFQAPVAVCTLHSDTLAAKLAGARPPAMSIVGSLHTENLGIEHIVRNLLPNSNIRFLVVCGEDTRKSVGHLPGQSLVSLLREGLDESGRIRGAQGKRPVIRNVSAGEIEVFRRRIEVVDLIGETNLEAIAAAIAEAAARDPGPDASAPAESFHPAVEQAVEAKRLVVDPAGYVVVYPDRLRSRLVLEHYSNAGVLTKILEGPTPAAIYGSAIAAGLISRLDHAAYLGRELARAEAALRDGGDYVQDKAPGSGDEEAGQPAPASCGCSGPCH
ncbi:MAG TPA: DUF4346 domain-containing protein [Rhodocyclaceae bacterium]